MFEKIHIWEFPIGELSVKVNPRFKKALFIKPSEHFGSIKNLANFLNKKAENYNKNVDYNWKTLWWQREKAEFVPFWVIYEISKYLGISKYEIENKIRSYRSFRGKNIISEPKLPVKVTPEFTSIAIHIMGDGSLTKGKFFFFQKREEDLERFKTQVKNVFGEYHTKGEKGHYVPKVLSSVVSKYYRIKSYSTFSIRLPKNIKTQTKFHRLAALTAFLSDEGYVSGEVGFVLSNKKFLEDIRDLALSLGYRCTGISVDEFEQKHNIYSFKIRADSIEKLYTDISELVKKWPTCIIRRKLKSIRKMVKIRNRNWEQRGKGETKNMILRSLENGPKTAFELRDLTNVTLWTVYHHLQDLLKKGMVTKGEKKGKRKTYLLKS